MLIHLLLIPTPKCALLFPTVYKSNTATIINFHLKPMCAFMAHFLDTHMGSTKAVKENHSSKNAL